MTKLAHHLQSSTHPKKVLQKMEKDSQIGLEEAAQASAHDQVREFVTSLLEQGMAPQQIAEELTYTAVEMSLQLVENKICVVPILMNSMSRAAQAYATYQEGKSNTDIEIEVDFCEIPNTTFH
jgi:hypothetical protein